MGKNILLSICAFVVYIAVIFILPLNSTYLNDLVMAICAIVITLSDQKWSWIKVLLFLFLILGFHVTLLYFVVSGSLSKLSSFDRLIFTLRGSGFMLLEYSATILATAGLSHFAKKMIKVRG